MKKGDCIDISNYFILWHCKKRWKKRFLKYTPINSKRIKDIDEIIAESKFKVIKEYPERGTFRVTDKRYEFIIHPEDKVIITVNAYRKKLTKKEYLDLKYDCKAKDLDTQIKKHLGRDNL